MHSNLMKVFTVGNEFKLTEEMKQTFRHCEKMHRVHLSGFFPEGAAEAQILEEAPYHILKVRIVSNFLNLERCTAVPLLHKRNLFHFHR